MFVTKKKYEAMMKQKEEENQIFFESCLDAMEAVNNYIKEVEERIPQEMILNFKHQFAWGITSQAIADMVDREIAKELEDGKEFE